LQKVTVRLEKNKNKLPPIIASIFALGWILFFFLDVVIHPNGHMFNEFGDGIKAFFVYADHIKNDTSYHQQASMNYPYGQTFVFTDGQPAIADAVKFISGFIPAFQIFSIAIYNYLILGSFILCAWFMALILQRLKLPPLFVILGAFCITTLSPQIWRISGHPTMSYACFFPIAWYLLLRISDSAFHLKWIVLAIVNTTFWFFVHPYLGMVITFFYAFYFLVIALSASRKKLLNARTIISTLFLVALPLFLLKVYSSHYDIHQYRSEFPWGFWAFYTAPKYIFLPHSLPFEPAFEYFFHLESPPWDLEKMNYIGLAIDAILLLLIFRMLRFVLRKKYSRLLNPVADRLLNFSFWAALLTLLFAMCIPFKWGLHSLVDHIGFLRQFRSLGRFGWAFYYVATAFGVYVFYMVFRYLRAKKLKVLAWTFLVIFFSLFVIEGYPDYKEKSHWAVLGRNLFNEKGLPPEYKSLIDEVNKQKDKYQCLVTLPFFHVGTENFGVDYSRPNINISCVVSYHCKIPMLASSAARSPIVEGRNIMQFFSPGFISKDIQKDLPSKKDFLIVTTKEVLNPQELAMKDNSTKIFDNGTYELWSLPYSVVFSDDSKKYIDNYEAKKDSLFAKGNFSVSNLSDTLDYKSYDSLPSEFTYKGAGALKVKKSDFTVLFTSYGGLRADTDYTVSFWYYNKGELRGQVMCIVEESDSVGNNSRWEILWDPRTSMVIDGDWSLVEKKFRIKDGTERIRIFVQGDLKSEQEIYIDEFLFRPSLTDVYAETTRGKDAYLFYNNYWIKK
jgi:hypothetical protein